MERSSCRITPSKASGSEGKTRQDGSSKHQRLPTYKDSTSPRPESRVRPSPQRSREVFDKRPRSKSGVFSERYRNEVVQEVKPQASIPKQGFKKVSMNHLLNFRLTTTEDREYWRTRVNSRMKLPKYNKEQFLQANCQFVTRNGEDYSVLYKNPDILVEWSKIEEVRLPTHEVPSCPICLYSPIAAKITRCGHIYCWPCILHYLSLTDKPWQKCPICFESVHKTDLKSVLPTTRKLVNVGQELTMHLMKRERGSLFPVPATYKTSMQVAFSVSDDEGLTSFQKLLLANHNHICSIIQRERFELQELLGLHENDPEACFIETALQLLLEREENVKLEQRNAVESPLSHSLLHNNLPYESRVEKDFTAEELRGLCSVTGSSEKLSLEKGVAEKSISISESPLSTKDHSASLELQSADRIKDCYFYQGVAKKSIAVSQSPLCTKYHSASLELEPADKRKDCYFYQADDGQHIYLHSINVRMLIKEFGSLENSPLVIKAKPVELERASMTEALRKKLCYLRHLPLTCEFQVAELNLSSVLSKSTMDAFSAEVEKRRKNRNRKARSEERREKCIEEEEKRKLGKYPVATYNLDSVDQFPLFDCESEICIMPDSSYVGHVIKEDLECEPEHGISSSSSNGASFAQMLSKGHNKVRDAVPVMNFWTSSTSLHLVNNSDDEYTPVPEYRQSFSDAIQAAMDNVNNPPDSTCVTNSKSVNNKKKKAKQKLLFTTSMYRNK